MTLDEATAVLKQVVDWFDNPALDSPALDQVRTALDIVIQYLISLNSNNSTNPQVKSVGTGLSIDRETTKLINALLKYLESVRKANSDKAELEAIVRNSEQFQNLLPRLWI